MKAYIFESRGRLILKDVAAPVISDIPDDRRAAILRPRYVSPCSSDVHTVFGGSKPRRENMILGHEGLAEVVETGSEVRDFKKGELVAVSAVMPDIPGGTGHEGFPFSGGKLGRNMDGLFAELFKVPDADMNLAKIPEGLSPEAALMSVDVMTTGFTAAEYADIRRDDTVIVMGTGPIGLMAIAAAKRLGAGPVIAMGSEKREECIRLSREYGADMYISYRSGDIIFDNGRVSEKYAPLGKAYEMASAANSLGSPAVSRIFELTGSRGAERILICGGGKRSLMSACDMASYGTGTVVNAAYIEGTENPELPLFSLGKGMAGKTFKFIYCKGGRARIEEMMKIAGKRGESETPDPAPLVTHRLKGFENIPAALEMMREKPAGLIKVMVEI